MHDKRSSREGLEAGGGGGIHPEEEKAELAWAFITYRRTPVQKAMRGLSVSTEYEKEREWV